MKIKWDVILHTLCKFLLLSNLDIVFNNDNKYKTEQNHTQVHVPDTKTRLICSTMEQKEGKWWGRSTKYSKETDSYEVINKGILIGQTNQEIKKGGEMGG